MFAIPCQIIWNLRKSDKLIAFAANLMDNGINNRM